MTNSVYGIGLSALHASQAGLRLASQNVANANTPGYVRAELKLAPTVVGSWGGGVDVAGITRAANTFLARATHDGSAAENNALVRAEFWSRAQAEFGDPAGETSLFAKLDGIWASLSNAAIDPTSPFRRDETIDALDKALSAISQAAGVVQGLSAEADARLSETVGRAQSLIDGIAGLNVQIGVTESMGGDVTGPQNAQAAMIDDLAKLMDLRVSSRPNGSVEIRTRTGALLVGEGATKLGHTQVAAAYAAYNPIMATDGSGASFPLDPYLKSGELRGLLDTRDQDLKAISESLGELAAHLTDALNAVHAENSAAPAPTQLTGRNTGLLASDMLNFSGTAVIGIINPDQELHNRLTIDFDAGTITSASPATSYTFVNRIGSVVGAVGVSFTEALNTALAANMGGSASFAEGRLTLTGGAAGLVVQQDQADPSSREGRGFSHFFGLGDLVRRDTPSFFEVGAAATDLHGLQAGGDMTFRITDGLGRNVGERTIAISGALAGPTSTWSDLVTALNAPTSGLAGYATAAFNAAAGRIEITPLAGFTATLTSDSTRRGDTNISAASLFGLTYAARGSRASELSVRPDIAADTSKLALGKPDLSATLGERVVEKGDNRGATALAAVKDRNVSIAQSGVMSAQTASISLLASRLGGELGRRASQSERDAEAAAAVTSAASARRAATEGVSLDDELIKLTTFQQSYAAAARVIQAATDMFEILMRLGA